MARETSLWTWLSRASKVLRDALHMHRVENLVMKGMPDVEGFLLDAGQFWLELKSSERPARSETPVRFKVRGREAQARWLNRRWNMGGAAWLLLQVGSGPERRVYLVPGCHAQEVYVGVNEERLAELDVLREPRVRPETVVRRAATR
ncbi:hypothetical protein ELZ19_06975 [Brucella abortus]|uniref:hypothetical protein n=1 Tax=Brucella abortus TaxID=235 RepID=UPI0005C7AA7F|nr:hypothetical protein [Brucella abortus]RUQ67313.1 hypothetical protein ELZ23_15405 [Brucella abortus]RUQ78556.1 hypothetical protein ELZ22_16920 [Brucella abortus]RUQ88298.1 hypothetical protein ELZ18_15675 [Brucella abortus]RUQ90328.1 hypothetical protein ELZ20_15675 [Brucella abortus]RUR06661.1 hypothetical protein ELZ19_06975 [Brucella abortus]